MRSYITRLLKGILTPNDTARKCRYEGLNPDGSRIISQLPSEAVVSYNRDGDLESYAAEREQEYSNFKTLVERYYESEGQNA